jgi:anthranilate synthase/phosphoribosyltransferase
MAVRHKHHETYGVQFHPESILTEHGSNIISNFLCDVVGIKSSKMSIPSIPREKRTALKKYIAKAADGINLTEDEAYAAMDIIMSDAATDAQTAAFLAALRMKGETIDEITGFARVMRQKASIVPVSKSAVDIVGTGGTLHYPLIFPQQPNLIREQERLRVAKHGNRSVSRKSVLLMA